MRICSLLGFVVVLSAAVTLGETAASQPCSRLDQLQCIAGVYTVRSATKYRGGLTTEAEASSIVGSQLVLTSALYKFRDKEIKNPRYVFKVIALPTKEGDIRPKDVSTFWGYEGYDVAPTHVVKLKVYSGATFIWSFEVISPTKLLDAYDGYHYEATR